MKRAALYARFSSDRQNERSIDDQIAGGREYCQRENFTVAAIFIDRAISGAAAVNRPDYQAMIAKASDDLFDVIVTEDMDRLIRDQGDYHVARKRLDFLGIELHTWGGKVGKLDGTLHALRAEMFLDNLAAHTRRGMEGVIRDGRSAGGRPYGYIAVPGKPGELTIVEREAEVVRRIFAAYIAGQTPRQIAGDLNTCAVAPPRGLRWNASTINGNLARGSGIILNEIYAGRIVWNKIGMIKNPATGRRVSRANPKPKHRVADAPHLRIVDEATWRTAQQVKRSRGHSGKPHQTRKPQRLLSGLIRCGSCGSGMTSVGKHNGAMRLQCSRHRESGACNNSRKVPRAAIERAVLDGLRDQLDKPAVLAEYAAEYNRERRRLTRSDAGKIACLERAAAEIARELERALDAIIKAGVDPLTLAARIKDLERSRDRIASDLAELKATPQVITLHPAAIVQYRSDAARLADLLASERDGECDELIDTIRRLVAAVIVLAPPRSSGFAVEIQGRLAQLTATPAFPAMATIVGGGSMVAGGRYRLSPPTVYIPFFIIRTVTPTPAERKVRIADRDGTSSCNI